MLKICDDSDVVDSDIGDNELMSTVDDMFVMLVSPSYFDCNIIH